MFLVDDIAFYPVKSILSLFREIYNAAVQAMADEADALRAELGELYQRLEAGSLDEADFDARERQILDRLDEIEARDQGDEDEQDEDEQDEDEQGDEGLDDEADDDES